MRREEAKDTSTERRWGSRTLQGSWRDAREWVCWGTAHGSGSHVLCAHMVSIQDGKIRRALRRPFSPTPLPAYKVAASTYWWRKDGSKFTYQNSELGVVKHEPVWGFSDSHNVQNSSHATWELDRSSSNLVLLPTSLMKKLSSWRINVLTQDNKAKKKKKRNAFLYALSPSIRTDPLVIVGKN